MSGFGRFLPRALHQGMSAVEKLADSRSAQRDVSEVPEADIPRLQVLM
jgi:hypothetical protein